MRQGRPPKRDPEAALEQAGGLFLRHGYHGVGVAELSRHMGVPPQSLYNRYGDKAGLFRAVLDHYGRHHNDPVITDLQAGPAREAVERFIRNWRRHRGADASGGCLFTCVMAMGDRDDPQGPDAVARAYNQRVRTALIDALRRAAAADQLSAEICPQATADALLTLAFGVAVIGRGGMSAAMIDHAVRAGLTLLEPRTVP